MTQYYEPANLTWGMGDDFQEGGRSRPSEGAEGMELSFVRLFGAEFSFGLLNLLLGFRLDESELENEHWLMEGSS